MIAAVVLAIRSTSDTDTAATGPNGSLTISVQDLTGLDGYQLLAVVWQGRYGDLVGAAFWDVIDSDPFSAEDIAHPPYWGDELTNPDNWAAGDYLWEEVAILEPGPHRIELFANPVGLAPYGSHIPADPIERRCSVDIEVTADEPAAVTVTDIPTASTGDQCPQTDT